MKNKSLNKIMEYYCHKTEYFNFKQWNIKQPYKIYVSYSNVSSEVKELGKTNLAEAIDTAENLLNDENAECIDIFVLEKDKRWIKTIHLGKMKGRK